MFFLPLILLFPACFSLSSIVQPKNCPRQFQGNRRVGPNVDLTRHHEWLAQKTLWENSKINHLQFIKIGLKPFVRYIVAKIIQSVAYLFFKLFLSKSSHV